MKKFLNLVCLLLKQHRKKLIVMRNTVLIVLISAFQVFATGSYAQTKTISLAMNDATIREVLYAIQNQSEFYFLYNSELVDVTKKVDITIEDEKVDKILTRLFDKNEVDYLIKDRYIVLTPVGGNAELFAEQQQPAVSGTVTDDSDQPLPGVTVVVKGTTQGTVTNVDGDYSLTNIPEDATLVFSFVGMRTQEIVVGNQTTINITLKTDAIGIEEVVAVGYGTQRRGNLTGSISSVKSEELTVAPIASTANTLAGRLPGLVSVQRSGQPGADAPELSIRGFGNPLIIVDGIETDFNSIDASQIESISILKDGSASIYGSRAGNGVILVTTKRGVDGKPMFTFNSSYTLQGITKMAKPVSAGQYAEMAKEEWINQENPVETAPFTPEEIQKYYDGTDPLFPNTNWYDELIKTWAPQQQHNLSVRGGSDAIKYYGYLGYLDQGTLFKKNGGDYKRYNFQSNVDAKILDNLSMQLTLASTVEDRNYPFTSISSGEGSVWGYYWNTLPIYHAGFPDPDKVPFAFGAGTGGAHVTSNRDISGYNDTDRENMKGTLTLDYSFNFIKGLSAKAFFNYNKTYVANKQFSKPVDLYEYDPASDVYTIVGAYNSVAKLEQRDDKSSVMTGQYSLNYENTFGNHRFKGLALLETIDYKSDWFNAQRQDYLTDAIDQLFGGSTEGMSNNGSASEMGRVSVVGRINYSYRNKYLVETIIRADASAKFPKSSRWGYFPSVSLGWRISEENFMGTFNSLDDLKIRASYGESGNDAIGNFQYLSGYQLSNLPYLFETGPQNGLASTGLPNPYLTWEQIKNYNAGFDFSFFNRKLYGETDVFYRERIGIMATRLITLPNTFGASLPPENLNSLNDRGFELKLGTAGQNANISWDISGNLSWSRAKWDYYEEPDYEDPDQLRMNKRSGQWTDRIFGYISDGVFTSQEEIDALTFDHDQQGNVSIRPGEVRYIDVNDDGVLDWKDQVEIGKGTTPHWMAGLNVNFKYKNFDVSGLFQGAFAYSHRLTYSFSARQLYPTFVYEERWTEENNRRDVLIPRLGSHIRDSDFNFHDAGYIRLKVFSFGYSIPQSWLQNANISQCRIYLSGTNLLTFSKLSKYGLDPEAPSSEGARYYPQQRTLSLGASISF